MSSIAWFRCCQVGRPSLIRSIHIFSRYRQISVNAISSLRSLTLLTSHSNNLPIKTVLDCQLKAFKNQQNTKHILLCHQILLNRNISRNMSLSESKRSQKSSTKDAKTSDVAKSTPVEQPLQTGPSVESAPPPTVITGIPEDVVEAVVGKKSEISEGE